MAQKKNTSSTSKTAAVGVAGAVIGAGVAAVATTVLADKKNRKKIMGAINDARDHVMTNMDKMKEDMMEGKKKIEDKLKQGKSETRPAKKTVKRSSHKAA